MNDFDNLRKDFSKVDIKNLNQLFKWFDDHQYLSVNDHAQIANRSVKAILEWKRKVGIHTPLNRPTTRSYRPIKRATIDLEIPDNWDTKEWLETHIVNYNVRQLARAIGIHNLALRRRLIKYNISFKNSPSQVQQSNNECNNYDWCYHHYVTLKLTQAECAKKAGVWEQAFIGWLNRYKIKVRSLTEVKFNVIIPLWIKNLYYSLKKQSIVKKIRINENYLLVKYRSRLYDIYYFNESAYTKRWFTFNVTEEISRINKIPSVNQEYENELDEEGQFYFHYGVNRQEWDNASLIERILAYHEFVFKNTDKNWRWPKYPSQILNQDKEALINIDESQYLENDAITCSLPSIPRYGRRIMLHYFTGPDIIAHLFTKPYVIRKLTRLLLKRSGSRINTENLIKSAFWVKKIHVADPILYTILLKQLKIKGLVLDLDPGYGSRAIACAINGLRYGTLANKQFEKAIDHGFIEFSGLRYESFVGQKISLLLCDFEGENLKFQSIMEFMKIAFRTIIFVPKQHYNTIYNVYKPTSVIKVKMKFNHDYDYWFLYEQTKDKLL